MENVIIDTPEARVTKKMLEIKGGASVAIGNITSVGINKKSPKRFFTVFWLIVGGIIATVSFQSKEETGFGLLVYAPLIYGLILLIFRRPQYSVRISSGQPQDVFWTGKRDKAEQIVQAVKQAMASV